MHRFPALVAVAALVTLLSAPSLHAQEVQVPLDNEGRLTVIEADLESRLNLFTDYDHFTEARLFRQADGTFVLVVQYEENGSIVQDREALSAVEVDALRDRISQSLASANIRTGLDQEGRVSLLWTSTLMSFLAYGPSLVGMLDIEDETAAGTTILLTGAGGFFVPYYVTESIAVSRSAAALARTGSTVGYLHGVALAVALGGENVSERAVLGAGLAVSLAEAFGGYDFATRTGISHGSVETITSGSLFGAGVGMGLSAILIGEDPGDTDGALRAFAGLGFAGSAAGAYAGYRLSRAENYSRGDARVLSTVGLLGVQAGAALVELTGIQNARPAAGLIVASTMIGLATGHALTNGRDFASSEGNFMALGSLAGGLAGAAVSNLVGGGTSAYAVLSTIGSAAGFAVMYVGFRDDAAQRADRSINLSLAPTFDPAARSVRPGFRLKVGL